VKVFDGTFFSCAQLRELTKRLSPDLVALQISSGPLEGKLRIFSLGAFRLNLLETNQTLFISGARRPNLCTLAIPLNTTDLNEPYQVQGIPLLWPGLMGFNRKLMDFDMRLPAGSRLATLVISHEHLLERHQQHAQSQLALKRWHHTNQLELRDPLARRLRNQLQCLINQNGIPHEPEEPDQLIESVLSCFKDAKARTMGIAPREVRHEAGIELLHWFTRHPERKHTAEELSQELHQSRTSLFKGCKEHFGQTPLEMQRSIRLDLVRQRLLNQTGCQQLGLNGIWEIALQFGFRSRSHFTRRFEAQYGEQPQKTLRNFDPNLSEVRTFGH